MASGPGRDDDGYERMVRDLVQVPAEVEVVKRIFADAIAGTSQMALARTLNRERIPSATAVEWNQASVRNILVNPLYTGRIRHAGNVYDGAHERVISDKTFEEAAAIRELVATRREGTFKGAAKGTNNGGGRRPNASHLFTRGLLKCGTCGGVLSPRTQKATGSNAETYRCLGRCSHGIDYCPQGPVPRAEVDAAILKEISQRYLDLDETRARLRAKRSADAARASEALATAERDLMRAENALARIERDYIDGKIRAEKWERIEAGLLEERDAAKAATERTTARTADVGDEAEEETLRRLAALRAALLGKLDTAPDLYALRTLLRQLFECVYYLRAGHPWIDMWELRANAPEVGGGAYLLPAINHDISLSEGTPVEGTDWTEGGEVRRLPLALEAGATEPASYPGGSPS